MKINKIEKFVTEEVAKNINEIKPWENCKKCRAGYKSPFEFCDCTERIVKEQILNIPQRYNVEFDSPAYQKEFSELISKPFIVLVGAELYTKLIGFDIAKKLIKKDKVAIHVYTQTGGMDVKDVIALSQADLVLFDDVAGKMTDVNYKIEIKKRMDKNKQTIFLNYPLCVNIEDEPDVNEYDVESISIKIR